MYWVFKLYALNYIENLFLLWSGQGFLIFQLITLSGVSTHVQETVEVTEQSCKHGLQVLTILILGNVRGKSFRLGEVDITGAHFEIMRITLFLCKSKHFVHVLGVVMVPQHAAAFIGRRLHASGQESSVLIRSLANVQF